MGCLVVSLNLFKLHIFMHTYGSSVHLQISSMNTTFENNVLSYHRSMGELRSDEAPS